MSRKIQYYCITCFGLGYYNPIIKKFMRYKKDGALINSKREFNFLYRQDIRSHYIEQGVCLVDTLLMKDIYRYCRSQGVRKPDAIYFHPAVEESICFCCTRRDYYNLREIHVYADEGDCYHTIYHTQVKASPNINHVKYIKREDL